MNMAGVIYASDSYLSAAYYMTPNKKQYIAFFNYQAEPVYPGDARMRDRPGITCGDGDFFVAHRPGKPISSGNILYIPADYMVEVYSSGSGARKFAGYVPSAGNEYILVETETYQYEQQYCCSFRFGRFYTNRSDKWCASYTNGNGVGILCDTLAEALSYARSASYCISYAKTHKSPWGNTTIWDGPASPWYPAMSMTLIPSSCTVPDITADCSSFSFKKGEYAYWCSKAYDYPHYAGLMDQARFYEAYYTAAEKLPVLQQNTIANISETVSIIRSLLSGYKGTAGLFDTAKEAWLAWRYSYNTTKSDITELATLVDRLCDLQDSLKPIRVYGVAYGSDGAAYHAAIDVDPCQFLPDDFTSLARTANARISLTNVWDMIPYSFVVDWFLPIGDMCKNIDEWLNQSDWVINTVWYSYAHISLDSERVYFRFRGEPPALPRFWTPTSASNRTKCFRAADTLALFF